MSTKIQTSSDCNHCGSKDKGIFCQMEEKGITALSDNKVMNQYKKGQTIFLQGNPAYGIYCVSNGQIKLTKVGNQGKETIVGLAGNGDVIGEASFFTGRNYQLSATALTDTKVCFIDKRYFLGLLKEDSSIALNLLSKMSKEIEDTEEKIVMGHQKNVLERLATLLIDLSEVHGVKVDQKRTKIDLKLSREEMASLIATAPETLIRTISELRDEGILDQEGKLIIINDHQKLQELTGN
jgi:CRP-like cAMP-binding protein